MKSGSFPAAILYSLIFICFRFDDKMFDRTPSTYTILQTPTISEASHFSFDYIYIYWLILHATLIKIKV